MPIINVLLGVGWLLFWLYWLVSAFGAKKNTAFNQQSIGIRLGLFILVFLIIRLSGTQKSLLNHPVFSQHNVLWAGVGFILFVCGLSFAIWARRHLGKNWGMPMSLKQDPELVTSGPYHYVRHPIYSGILLAILGSALVSSTYWLVVLPVIGLYFIYSAIEEEKTMLSQFPKEYPAYKSRTKMLVPFIL